MSQNKKHPGGQGEQFGFGNKIQKRLADGTFIDVDADNRCVKQRKIAVSEVAFLRGKIINSGGINIHKPLRHLIPAWYASDGNSEFPAVQQILKFIE